jgi:hypothetical protein
MSNPTATKVIEACVREFPGNQGDCNHFLKAVAAHFFPPTEFAGTAMTADAIIGQLIVNNAWSKLGTSHESAVREASEGKFVIAGMTSTELSSAHGHVAIVIGDPAQLSGNVPVPICYAGSLNSSARVQRRRISETFPAADARNNRIAYFSRTPNVNT